MSSCATSDISERNNVFVVYDWIDSIPLSRPKRNIARDFSDCVLVAEIVHHYRPSIVSLHNYPSTCNAKQKLQNWETMNMKVFKKIGVRLTQVDIDDCANVCPQYSDVFLFM